MKRLSARSRHSKAEFRNEVELIAKLQHRNRSLDAFLFGVKIGFDLVTHGTCLHMTEPNCRYCKDCTPGLGDEVEHHSGHLSRCSTYEDSYLKIVHRDLKASNVFLDNKMNPKISDFSMAKIFEDEVIEVNTGFIIACPGLFQIVGGV